SALYLGLRADYDTAELYDLLRLNAGRDPLLYGAAIAFAPYAFHENQRLFSPYVYDSDLKAIDIGAEAYDYTSGGWEWYSAVEASGEALWTEPYFDTGAGNMAMTTYSAPINHSGEFIGVATIDLRLDRLSQQIAAEMPDQKFMVMGPSGRFVSHYDP